MIRFDYLVKIKLGEDKRKKKLEREGTRKDDLDLFLHEKKIKKKLMGMQIMNDPKIIY